MGLAPLTPGDRVARGQGDKSARRTGERQGMPRGRSRGDCLDMINLKRGQLGTAGAGSEERFWGSST